MIKLKFTYIELAAFNRYLENIITRIKNSIAICKRDLASLRVLKAELFEVNQCYLKVNRQLKTSQILSQQKKKYTLSLTPMQGLIICENFEQLELSDNSYIYALLVTNTDIINKTLLL